MTARHQKIASSWHAQGIPVLKFVALALSVVLVSGAGIASIAFWKLSNAVAHNAVDISNGKGGAVPPPPHIGSFDGGFNILAVGADNAPGQAYEAERGDGTLNDVNILLHVAADHQSAVALSLPRDLVIPQPACVDAATGEEFSAVSAQPLNSAYSRGGLGCVVSTVEELTGLSIPYAATFTFAGTIAMSDAVGGVPICLNAAVKDDASGLDLPAGTSVVSGQQALSYLRARERIGDGSDLSRISSQQAYMSSLMRVMKSSKTLTDPAKVLGLATAASENVSLSTSLAHLSTMASMAITLKDLDLSRLVFVQYPSVEDPDNKNKIIPNDDLAVVLLAKIQTDQPFALGDGALGNEVILDPAATTIDAATNPAPTGEPETVQPGAAPTPVAPEIIGGLRGQTAAQQTCSVAYHY
ncbi:LCP family protein [Glaciibacter psychrotolerans]|uniref:LCP family protein required for cell wall assembly n=1 Tax=Glaciibacter psychrotolerans TaxID=670054 RepID=A0A7Z0EE89_9MICO|nr:LCP family protein [Leifsonia psychrotolerans]NYJ20043.1 LCP family protein required for cell wall assembly [Leifsonia psychrotolerans]